MPKPRAPLPPRSGDAFPSFALDAADEASDIDLYERVVAYAANQRPISPEILQREFGKNLGKAQWLIDKLHAAGIIDHLTSLRQSLLGPVRVGLARSRRNREINSPYALNRRANYAGVDNFFNQLSKFENNGFNFWMIRDREIYFSVRDVEIATIFTKENSHLFSHSFNISLTEDNSHVAVAVNAFDTRGMEFFEEWQLKHVGPRIYIAIPTDTDKYKALLSSVERALGPVLSQSSLSPREQQDVVAGTLERLDNLHSAHESKEASQALNEHEAPQLPAEAPALWTQHRAEVANPETSTSRLENAGEFTRRVYGPWLGNGMTRNLLRKLDNPLFQALYRAYGANLPDDLPLPTKKEENDRWVARVEQEGLAAVISESSPASMLKEASRLQAAIQRRKQR